MKTTIVATITGLALAFVTIIFAAVISFVAGWLGGQLLSLIFGDLIVACLNTLFDTTRFTHDFIPVLCGLLAVIGSYFKSTSNNEKKD